MEKREQNSSQRYAWKDKPQPLEAAARGIQTGYRGGEGGGEGGIKGKH